MNFMNRKMFADGGASTPLGSYQYRYKGKVQDLKPNFIQTLGTNPYKLFPLIESGELEFGDKALQELLAFQKKDPPGIGPLRLSEDIGTNVIDFGLGAARIAEPVIKGGIRSIGELFGSDTLRDIGGGLTFDGKAQADFRTALSGQEDAAGLLPFVGSTNRSLVPTDRQRAEYNLGRYTDNTSDVEVNQQALKDAMARGYDPSLPAEEQITTGGQFDFREDDINARVSRQDDTANQAARREFELQKYSPEDQEFLRQNPDISPEEVMMRPVTSTDFNPFTDPITPMMDELTQERVDLEDRFAEENIQRPPDVDVDEITSLLNDIQEPSINIDKTEADSLLETIEKFDGLSPDELKVEIEKEQIPGMDALDDQKEAVKQQVERIKVLEAAGINPDDYFNRAPRNPVDKKLNEPGFFGSDRFLNFIRNVGAGLVETGQIGSGLATGAAKASEERAARELMADERKAEMDKLIAIEKAKAALEPGDKLEPKQIIDLAGEMNADYNDIISNRNVLEVIDRVEAIVLNEDTTSGKAIVSEFLTKAGSVFNVKTGKADPNGKSWDQLDSRTRARVLLNQITQKNIRDILGESGKTISNLDRQIVERLVGTLKAGTTDAEVLETLQLTRSGVMANRDNSISRLESNNIGMRKYGDINLVKNTKLLDYLRTGILEESNYSNQYTSFSLPRTKITL